MSDKKKHILFTYSQYTVASTLAFAKRLLAMFPSGEFETHTLLLDGDRPDAVFQDYVRPIKSSLYLHFNFDCLGFLFNSYDDTPFYNTFWTPCVTYLTVPAARLSAELGRDWNLNITVLCGSAAETKYVQTHYPEISDVRTVINPLTSAAPLYQTLLEIARRY